MTHFTRYDNLPAEGSAAVRMPCDILEAKVSNLTIAEIVGRFEDYAKDPDAMRCRYPWAIRFVMGFPIPEFQRGLKWTLEQKERFITSIWERVDLGSYMVNDIYEFIKLPDGTEILREYSDALLDGQQRLMTMEQYLLNMFPVADVEGNPRYWRELDKKERRRFLGFTFARATVASWDRELLVKAYNLRALGGTPHEESERAV